MDKGEVTTLLDLSAAFDNKPEYLTDLLVWPKCSKYLHSTNSNRFIVHLEIKSNHVYLKSVFGKIQTLAKGYSTDL